MSQDQQKNQKLSGLSYEKFRELALDDSLSKFEKIGFFNEFRQGKEADIFEDFLTKLPALNESGKRVLDIGAGCSDLPLMLIDWCKEHQHHLVVMDSLEMLNNLPNESHVEKAPGMFPNDFDAFVQQHEGTFDVIIIYSVLHYIVVEGSWIKFQDALMRLLSRGGMALIGDIPNVSKRNRFFSSPAGIRFHQERNGAGTFPDLKWNTVNAGEMDDAMTFAILQRARLAGVESYILPQPKKLPMANRREDILLVKP